MIDRQERQTRYFELATLAFNNLASGQEWLIITLRYPELDFGCVIIGEQCSPGKVFFEGPYYRLLPSLRLEIVVNVIGVIIWWFMIVKLVRWSERHIGRNIQGKPTC